jgi:hypothetical protein
MDLYRILFHNDLDGICCAAHFLNIGPTDNNYVLHPVKTQIRGEKFDRLVDGLPANDIIAIFDYQYHKRAKVWVDHHHNSVYPEPGNSFLVNDVNAKSAFSILAPARKDIVEKVNMVDACLYPDVMYIFESIDPVMTLNRFIVSTFPHDMIWCRIAEILAKTDFDFEKTVSILGLNPQEFLDREQAGCEDVKNFMCIHDGRIAVTHLNRQNEYPRYAEFCAHKMVDYAIRQISLGNGKCQIEIGFNPFAKENLINIGMFMSTNKLLSTGGGHKDVGGGILLEKDSEKFILEFVETLNGGNKMEKLAVDQENDKVEKKAQELVKEGFQKDIVEARKEVVDGSDSKL